MSQGNEIELSLHRRFRLGQWLVEPSLGRISREADPVEGRKEPPPLAVPPGRRYGPRGSTP
jgi:hypothetical protein